MASNLLSRLLPSNLAGRSIYDDLRAHDEASESDLEANAGALDEENLGFHDDDLHHADVFGEDSHITTASTVFPPHGQTGQEGRAGDNLGVRTPNRQSTWVSQSPRLLEEDPDDDVPASLLIEGNDVPGPSSRVRTRQGRSGKPRNPIPGPSNRETRAHWEAAQAQQRLHREESAAGTPHPVRRHFGSAANNAREKAMWRWINVMNVDRFVEEVYGYYIGAGMWAIILEKVLNLAQSIFIAIFIGFLTQCVEWQDIPHSKRLSEVVVPQCTKKISGMANVAIWIFTLRVFYTIYQLVLSVPKLMQLRDFYQYLLEIPESDMQTISWQDVVGRIMALRDSNPKTAVKISPSNRKFMGSQSKERLDAHDIANRLMRRENYMIALFNKEILDLTLPVPILQGRQFFSKSLLWNIEWCILDLLFNDLGQVRQLVLKDSHRRELSDGLRNRFLFAGVMNALFAPIIVIYLVLVYFLRYFNEFKTNPSALGSRSFTPLAEWKFREFNELHHLFHKRINMSYPFASRYLDQFPKVKSAQFARFVAFVAGAIVSVLAVASLWDPELFLNFEITSERTVLFYLGVFGSLWAVMNGSIPEENLVFEPEYALRNVIEYTHYMPSNWQGRLHSDEVKREFSTLYQLKIVLFVEEVLSILVTPFVLWFSLPKCSDQIIDFFREFTIHVDGVGYVCSFAVFDFKKGNGKKQLHGGGSADVRDDYYSTKHGKMAASYFGFLDNYALNPKTAVQGHVPPGTRHQHNPPPNFPGLGSPNMTADMHTSRMGRSERWPGNKSIAQAGRTPRFPPVGTQGSPVQSILLDPHHQPSSSGFGGRSVHRTSRSRYQTRTNIIEEQIQDEDELEYRQTQSNESKHPYGSVMGGLEESRWETTGARPAVKDIEEDEADAVAGGGGVLGLLYQFQKAQAEGGVHM